MCSRGVLATYWSALIDLMYHIRAVLYLKYETWESPLAGRFRSKARSRTHCFRPHRAPEQPREQLIAVFALKEGHAKTIPCSFSPPLPSLCFVLWVWTYFFPSPLAIFLFFPFTLPDVWKQLGGIERRVRGQYAQGLQGRDNSIEGFQQQGPVFVLLVIITSFFPSSISYMTSGIHGTFLIYDLMCYLMCCS